ncbi:adenosylcobinamide-GDP ribazoletransferase [Paenibacillus daejeonensis]|uniref:adenosylcobinamide-GDP ribazoletransferase n=1 Tax=Paenibacillus daejeonensis TaxID=135193 RepID=UPI0003756805|nr:adenosylcobinamide-GDP ribazoletransferase [Paenibacillus daejeonensis]
MVGKRVGGWVADVVIALQFLTRLPLLLRPDFTPAAAARSLAWFPFAGLVIGLLLLLTTTASSLLPTLPAAIVVLAVWIALSGGLHLDGWMDTADGVLSHRNREQMLEIMKDSRVGAMGVIAGVLLLLFKFSLLTVVLEQQMDRGAWLWLITIPVWSRWWMCAAITLWPKAKAGSGMAALFDGAGKRELIRATTVALVFAVAAALIGGIPAEAAISGALLSLGVCVAVGSAAAWWLTRKLGGLTGDTYGAMNEALEAALLCLLVVMYTI